MMEKKEWTRKFGGFYYDCCANCSHVRVLFGEASCKINIFETFSIDDLIDDVHHKYLMIGYNGMLYSEMLPVPEIIEYKDTITFTRISNINRLLVSLGYEPVTKMEFIGKDKWFGLQPLTLDENEKMRSVELELDEQDLVIGPKFKRQLIKELSRLAPRSCVESLLNDESITPDDYESGGRLVRAYLDMVPCERAEMKDFYGSVDDYIRREYLENSDLCKYWTSSKGSNPSVSNLQQMIEEALGGGE